MIIRAFGKVVEGIVKKTAFETNTTVEEVQRQVSRHIEEIRLQYYLPSPKIKYNKLLCRAAYLHRHGAMQATVFEHLIWLDKRIQTIISNADKLHVVAIGGGPGTELLGWPSIYSALPMFLGS